MIESNKSFSSLLTRSFNEIRQSASSSSSAFESNGGNPLVFGSAPTQAAQRLSSSLFHQTDGGIWNLQNPKSMLPMYQAAQALKELGALLRENEHVILGVKAEEQQAYSPAQLIRRAHELSPLISDTEMIVSRPTDTGEANRAHHILQLLATYRQKTQEIESIENAKNN